MKYISPAIFGITAILFILPFVEISCSGTTLYSLSGFDMVTGTNIETNAWGKTNNVEIQPRIFAIASFVCVIIGFLFSFNNDFHFKRC